MFRHSEVERSLSTFETNSNRRLVSLSLTFVTSPTCLSFTRARPSANSDSLGRMGREGREGMEGGEGR